MIEILAAFRRLGFNFAHNRYKTIAKGLKVGFNN